MIVKTPHFLFSNPEDGLPFDQTYSSIFEVKPPKPNMSAQFAPLSYVNDALSAKQVEIENYIKILKFKVLETERTASQVLKLYINWHLKCFITVYSILKKV